MVTGGTELRFGVLGPVELFGEHAPALGRLQRVLLAYLLVNAGEAVSADRTIDAVWPRAPARGALKRLQVAVARLRKLLGDDAIETVSGGYRLRVPPGEVDAAVFEARLVEGRDLLEGGDSGGAAAVLRDALGLWRGPAFADVAFADFAQAEIRRLEELRLSALEARIDADLHLGRHAALVGELEGLLAEHPTRERIAGQLMLALYRSGRQAEALDVHQRTRVRLLDELGLEPGPALAALQAAVLRQDPELGPAPAPRHHRRPDTGFVGRAAAMEALQDAAAANGARVVALSGEPGAGKTRCAAELAARVAAPVVWGRCADEDMARPYGPWAQVLAALGEPADLAALPGAEAPGAGLEEARFARFDAVCERLRAAARRRLVVVLDDVQWADRSSLELLVHVMRHLTQVRLLVVVAFRSADVRRGTPLGRALAELQRLPGFARVELDGLGERDVAGMLEAAGVGAKPETVRAVRGRTAGNPFYVAELARAMLDGAALDAVPGSVSAAVGRRLERLPTESVDLLGSAAVLGPTFTLATLARTAGITPAEAVTRLEPALDAGLVHPGYVFAHAIVRDVVYAELGAAVRCARHTAALAALEDRRPEGAPELAHHALVAARSGGDPEPALRHAAAAARAATAALAHSEAATLYEQALEAEELADRGPAERLQLLLAAAAAYGLAGELDTAQRRYDEAADLAIALGDAEALADAALGYAEWPLYGVQDPRAVTLLEGALALTQRDGPRRAALLGRLAVQLDPHRDQPRRERLLDEALAGARAAGDPRALSRTLALSPLVHWRPEHTERRRRDALETLQLAVAGGDPEAELWARIVRYVDALSLGELSDAGGELVAYERLASGLRQPYYRWYGMVLRAGRLLLEGPLEEAERLSREAVALNRRYEPDSEQEHAVQSLTLAILRSRPQDADRELIDAYAERYPELPLWRALATRLAFESGDEAVARARHDRLADGRFAAMAEDPDRIATLAVLAEVTSMHGSRDDAVALYEQLLPYRNRNVVLERGWAAWGSVERPLGILAGACGDPEAAAVHFRAAEARNEAWRAAPWLVRTAEDERRCLHRSVRSGV